MSASWDEIWKKASAFPPISWYAEEFLQYLVRLSSTQESALFLEPGAGSGRFGYHLSERGIEIVALDFSRNSVRLLRKIKTECGKGFHIVRADVLHMPFRDYTFHVVYSEGVVEHFLKPHHVLREMTRVLRNFGILVFSVPNKFSFHTLGRFAVKKLMSDWWPYGYERSFSKNEVKRLLQSFGLKKIEVHGIGLFYGFGRYMPNALQAFLNYISTRTRENRLGAVLTEHVGFQVIGKGEKEGA